MPRKAKPVENTRTRSARRKAEEEKGSRSAPSRPATVPVAEKNSTSQDISLDNCDMRNSRVTSKSATSIKSRGTGRPASRMSSKEDKIVPSKVKSQIKTQASSSSRTKTGEKKPIHKTKAVSKKGLNRSRRQLTLSDDSSLADDVDSTNKFILSDESSSEGYSSSNDESESEARSKTHRDATRKTFEKTRKTANIGLKKQEAGRSEEKNSRAGRSTAKASKKKQDRGQRRRNHSSPERLRSFIARENPSTPTLDAQETGIQDEDSEGLADLAFNSGIHHPYAPRGQQPQVGPTPDQYSLYQNAPFHGQYREGSSEMFNAGQLNPHRNQAASFNASQMNSSQNQAGSFNASQVNPGQNQVLNANASPINSSQNQSGVFNSGRFHPSQNQTGQIGQSPSGFYPQMQGYGLSGGPALWDQFQRAPSFHPPHFQTGVVSGVPNYAPQLQPGLQQAHPGLQGEAATHTPTLDGNAIPPLPSVIGEDIFTTDAREVVALEHPTASLSVGFFSSSSDSFDAMNVFNSIDFTLILEAEDNGGDGHCFEYTHHRFGECQVVKLSQRLAEAFGVHPLGRFFHIPVPVSYAIVPDTAYNCYLTFPLNNMNAFSQDGLHLPRRMRFCTRVLSKQKGGYQKTPLTFHPFFSGTSFLHDAMREGFRRICFFMMKHGMVLFPKSFDQQPAVKLSRGKNLGLNVLIQEDRLLSECRKTMDPMVPFIRNIRPRFHENNVDGGRPRRIDTLDLLQTRRCCMKLVEIQNLFYKVPKPRRAHSLITGLPFAACLTMKRQEFGRLIEVEPTWLSSTIKKTGIPNWPGKSLVVNAPKLRAQLIRLHIATEFIVQVLTVNVVHDVELKFPRRSLYRIRRLRRKIRAHRRARRHFLLGREAHASLYESGDSMDDIPRDGLPDSDADDSGSEYDYINPHGLSFEETTMLNREPKRTYNTEEFLQHWHETPTKVQDFCLDPMFDCVLPWANIPHVEIQPNETPKASPAETKRGRPKGRGRTKKRRRRMEKEKEKEKEDEEDKEDQEDEEDADKNKKTEKEDRSLPRKWYPLSTMAEYGPLQKLRCPGDEPRIQTGTSGVDLMSLNDHFESNESDTDDSAVEGMYSGASTNRGHSRNRNSLGTGRRETVKHVARGGRGRTSHLYMGSRRGRGGGKGLATKSPQKQIFTGVIGADRLARALREDLKQKNPLDVHLIPKIIVQYE